MTRELVTNLIVGNSLLTAAGFLMCGEFDLKNCEAFVKMMEDHGVPFGTLIIDDFWGEKHGLWEADPKKWKDLRGFIDRQHKKRCRGDSPRQVFFPWSVLGRIVLAFGFIAVCWIVLLFLYRRKIFFRV